MIGNEGSDAFEDIYSGYYKPVYGYISRLVRNSTLAEDLTQEAFIKVLGGLMDVDGNKKLSPWIFRIAHNTCVDYLRKNRLKFEPIDYISAYDMESNCPEYIILNREKQNKIKEILSLIGQRYSKALLLRAYWNLSYREIASQLQIKEAAVKTLICRGRRQFREKYADAY